MKTKQFKEFTEKLNELPIVDLDNHYNYVQDCYKGTFELTIDNVTLYFDWSTYSDNTKLSLGSFYFNNDDTDEDINITDKQYSELLNIVPKLFDLENEEYEAPEKHAFNLGE